MFIKLILLILPLAILFQDPAAINKETISSDEQILLQLENTWNEAHLKGDAETLEKLWADDFTAIVPNMQVMTKKDIIGFYRTGRAKFQKYETTDIKIKIYDNAAIVTGKVFRSRNFNGNYIDDKWQFTKMYIKHDGKWQIIAWQAS